MSSNRFLSGITEDCAAWVFVLLLLAFAVYEKALWFVPTGDDVRILSSVSQTSNPLSYLWSDWGQQGTYRLANGTIDTRRRSYRPMHSISIWLAYRIVGVSAFPNQLINLVLHVLNCFLFYRIVRRVCPVHFATFLLVVLSLVSLYTASPAIWVSDRPTLVVGLSVLILLSHAIDSRGQCVTRMNPWIVTGVTLLAVSFQESGMVLPLIAGVFVMLPGYEGRRWQHLAWFVGLACAYLGLRIALFGSNAFVYASEGFVFGTRPYALLSDLPWQLGLWARIENVAKNSLCVFVPIIDSMGRIDSLRVLLRSVVWWLPTLLLAIAATRRPIRKVQWLALAIILLNAALHVQVFRYRVEYISQFAFCLYVADSRLWKLADSSERKWSGRMRLAEVCGAILALVCTSQVNHYVQANWVQRHDELFNLHLEPTTQNYPISPTVVEKIFERYVPGAQ